MTMFFGVLLAGVIGLTAGESSGVVLPLLATQILWINLVTDGAPALALGVDPADLGTMNKPPRPKGEGVITRRTWAGIFFVGAVMAAGTLIILDASLPGGLIEGPGPLRYGQTMAFTTLMLFQLFNVFNARSDERSAFHGLFTNGWLWAAIALSLVLHEAIFCLSARISSNLAVTSRMMATMPIIRLVSSRTGTIVNLSETPVPSIRMPGTARTSPWPYRLSPVTMTRR